MRIWDLEPKYLCQKHLIAEHRELHGIWNIITQDKIGYSRHPETKRWVGKLKALYQRHEQLVAEMKKRGYKHDSPLDKSLAKGKGIQDKYLHTKHQQKLILKQKPCGCFVKKLKSS